MWDLVRSAGSLIIYRNGGSPVSTGVATASTNIAGNIGQQGSYYMKGSIDEVRISNSARSAKWIAADYKSTNNTFIAFASAQSSFGTYTSPSNSNTINLNWNGGWGDGTSGSTGFSADVTIPANTSIAFQARAAATTAGLSSAEWKDLGTATTTGTYTQTKTQMDTAGVPTGSSRYIQVKATLATTDGANTPSLNSYSLYWLKDSDNPGTNPTVTAYTNSGMGTSITTDTWTTTATPYFSFASAADSDSGIEGYCLYFGADDTADPVTAKGLLGTTEQSGDNSTCQYVTYNNYVDLSTHLSSALTDGTYYLNVRAKDYEGNKYSSASYKTFTYKYDATNPSNPSALSAPQTYQNSASNITIYWPVTGSNIATDSASLVKGYQYKIGSSGTWYGSNHTGTQDCTDVIDVATGSYTLNPTYDTLITGENVFYFRTYDNACNAASSSLTATIKYSGIAPTEPQNLTVTPSTNTSNSFAFSWAAPSSYSGQASGITYCYSINSVPSEANCTSWISSTSLSADAYATQPSTNTFYVVAKDEAGNVNYAAFSSVNFTANTSAPGIPRSMDVSDISIKSTSNWKLTVTWEAPSDVGAGVTSYKVYRSTTATSCSDSFSSFTNQGSTAGTSYTDTGLTQTTYYYCVKACDSAANCSAVSSTVSKKPTGKYYTAASLTAGPATSSITTKKATITWSTDRNSDSKIQYGTTSGSYNSVEPSSSSQVTDHSIQLTGLNPGTTYYYKTKWTDEDGNLNSNWKCTT